MERIKQALDKARQERGTNPQAASGAAAKPAKPSAIEYSQTRSISVNEKDLHTQHIVIGHEASQFGDAYKLLRTQVLQRLNENDWNALAVTSPNEGAGKTLTAINLALSLAKEVNYTVLLVDANLRHPNLHSYFGFKSEKGLRDYLLDDAPLSELLVRIEGIDQFVMLPGGSAMPNSAEMLNSPRLIRLVEEMKTRYPNRIVIFDLPPVLTAADALAFSPYVDAALLVVEEGVTTQADLQRTVELLDCTNIIGTVLNKAAD